MNGLECFTCEGRGFIGKTMSGGTRPHHYTVQCPTCKGTGGHRDHLGFLPAESHHAKVKRQEWLDLEYRTRLAGGRHEAYEGTD